MEAKKTNTDSAVEPSATGCPAEDALEGLASKEVPQLPSLATSASYEGIAVVTDDTASGVDPNLAGVLAELFGAEAQAVSGDSASRAHRRRARLAAALPDDLREQLGLADAELNSDGSAEASTLAMGISEVLGTGDDSLVVVEAAQDALGGVDALSERALRTLFRDTLVLRDPVALGQGEGPILVCIDGSPQSYSGLLKGMALGNRLGRSVEAVAVYDPYIHYTLFNGIVRVLSAEASTVFKFKDQEKLHEEIIDTGLAKIYQAHLEVARRVAEEYDAQLKITLLDGKAFEKIIRYAAKVQPSLLILGRIGVHSEDDMDIGSNTENILRSTGCNLLVTSGRFVPRIDVQAEASVEWTPEARQKMERVPSFVKGVATTAILRWAVERGHSVITPSVINTAMGDLLPAGAAQAMGYVAEEVAKERDNLEAGNTYICAGCGYAARDFQPVACPVCKAEGASFDRIDREVLQQIGNLDGGDLEDQETFDGLVLRWSSEAKKQVRLVPAGYERRRCRARIEKTARVRGLTTITGDFALEVIKQDIAETSYLSDKGERLDVQLRPEDKEEDTKAVARDGSNLLWTAAAWARILRVPEGFMRDSTRERVEEVAQGRETTEINLELCEAGIAEGRKLMAELLANYTAKDSSPTA